MRFGGRKEEIGIHICTHNVAVSYLRTCLISIVSCQIYFILEDVALSLCSIELSSKPTSTRTRTSSNMQVERVSDMV